MEDGAWQLMSSFLNELLVMFVFWLVSPFLVGFPLATAALVLSYSGPFVEGL